MWPRPELDCATLGPPIAKAVGRQQVEVIDWRQELIHTAFNQTTRGPYRVTGTANAGGQAVKWSVILKIVAHSSGPFGGTADPAGASYWNREALIYQSGVLTDLPGIRAPRCFGIDRQEDGAAWIWLEDVRPGSSEAGLAAPYQLAAHSLGIFNGTYLAGRPIPAARCLSRDWLRAFVADFATPFTQLAEVRDHPLVRRCWPGELLPRVLRLWNERETFLRALEQLPQTFCHFDAFPRNLAIDEPTQQVVALDWSYAGIGAIGAELAPMVAASVSFFDAEPEQMASIDKIVFDAYVAGLRVAEWHGDAQLARLGYTAAASLHYGLFPFGIYVLEPHLRKHVENVFGHPVTEILDRWAHVVRFVLDQADEARAIAGCRRQPTDGSAEPEPRKTQHNQSVQPSGEKHVH
jgi:hypothetical protein